MLPADFNLEKRYFFSRLCDMEKDFYVFLLENLLKNQRKMFFLADKRWWPECEKHPELECFEYGKYENWFDIDIQKVYRSIIWDCPELYYVAYDDLSLGLDAIISIGADTPTYTDDEICEINKLLYGILHNFDHITDPFELELEVHDYIVRSFDYSDTYEQGTEHEEREFQEIFTPVGLIKTGRAVCYGISRLAQFIFQRRGLEVANVLADAGSPDNKCGHAWLAIKLGGNWYHLDVTYNESSSTDIDIPQYCYFNVTDEDVRDTHFHSLDEECPDIVCNSTEYNYYHKMGLYFTEPEQITEKITHILKENGDKHRFLYIRVSPELNEATVSSALADGFLKMGYSTEDCLYLQSNGYFALELFPKNKK